MARVLMNHLEGHLTEDVTPTQSDFSTTDNGKASNTA
jgi:hypothetical protein